MCNCSFDASRHREAISTITRGLAVTANASSGHGLRKKGQKGCYWENSSTQGSDTGVGDSNFSEIAA
ncbi:hypothetical protein AKJ16_DCAP22836 [Drosera capensis]